MPEPEAVGGVPNRDFYLEMGRIVGQVLERRKDRSKIAVMDFMAVELETSRLHGIEPDWIKLLKDSRRIWKENL